MNRSMIAGGVAVAVLATGVAAQAMTGAQLNLVVATATNIHFNEIRNLRPDSTDGPVANGHMFVTHNWNPGGRGGHYFTHTVAATNADGFSIGTTDAGAMDLTTAFNTLFFLDGSPKTFYQRATSANIQANSTVIDNALCNGNPQARLIVTPNVSTRGGITGVLNPHNIGVWYNGSKWLVFNQDKAAMPVNTGFSVYVETSYGATVVAATSNVVANSLYLSNIPALSGGNTAVQIVVTPNWSPNGGGPNVYNNHAIGVWYDAARRQWAIYNEDQAPMPIGAAFNVDWDASQATPG